MKEIFDLLREKIKSKKARTDNKCKELLESEGYSPDYRFFEGKSVGLRIATEQLDKAEAKWKEKEAELRASVIDEFAKKAKTDFMDYDMYLILHSNGIMNPQESVEYYKYMVDCFAREMKGEKSLSFKEFNEVREAEYERDI